ncbi:glutamine synthetase family protein [Rhodospirillaceae bacterium SYSU D60014]|uniref:glutamine synthetase family protein n=1 Tax=Virgifigura deserti TaxID=2268457 RepID=UPI000E66712C
MKQLEEWLTERKIDEVECLVPDMAGIARGKILPANKFIKSARGHALRLPESIFIQTVTGDYGGDEEGVFVTSPQDVDVYLQPDASTVRLVPWYDEPTAQVLNDCYYADGSPVEIASRHVLRRVLELYDERGWKPIVAPELEFFLVQINTDPDLPLVPPIGQSGRPESGRQSYGIDAVNEFDPIFEDVYDFCEAQEIDIDTLTHESGAAQMEINFNHGDPMKLADQAFLFKRTVRHAAMRHQVYATFMAKPLANEPGSSMHIHQSVVDKRSGRNLFADSRGRDSALFRAHVAGLQRYLPMVMPLLAPNVNSFRRLQPHSDAPINVHWGVDNRTVGLRVPISSPGARRVENRLAGADANPYLAIAASLACGYLGMAEKLKPTKQIEGSAYRLAHTLPRTLYDALHKFNGCRPLRPVLGEKFMRAVDAVKKTELDAYQRVISSWEREHLLLNV